MSSLTSHLALLSTHQLGTRALVSSLDIKHTFRLLHVPIHTSDINLLGYKVQGSFFLLINASNLIALQVVQSLKYIHYF